MKTHDAVDSRSLTMARRIVAKIDRDPVREGLEYAREVCARWVAAEAASDLMESVRLFPIRRSNNQPEA